MNIIKAEAGIYLAGGLAVVLVLWYAKKKATAAVDEVLPYVNPASDKNVVNQGVSWVGSLISGNPNWTLGGSIYDVTHDGSLNPASSNNIVNKGMESMWGGLLGDPNWTLGGSIYDWTH